MSENHSQTPEASRNKAENAGAGNTTTKPDYQKAPTLFGKWPWCAQLVLILSVIFCIVVLLVGLPLGSLMIVNNMSPDSLSPTMSFWGALFTAFISLTTLFIAATFAFTAFKVESGAKWEVRKAVEKEIKTALRYKAQKYINENGERLTREIAGGFLQNNGPDLTKGVAGKYLEKEGADLTKGVAAKYLEKEGADLTKEVAGKYLKNNGDRLTGEEASGYLKQHGAGLTREAADAYVEAHGEEITRKVIEKCARKSTGLTGWLRRIVKSKGAGESSTKDTQTGDKQASGDASSDTTDDGPNNTDSRS